MKYLIKYLIIDISENLEKQMNYSSLRKRRLISSRESAKRQPQNISEELVAKLECYTPVIGGKNKKGQGAPKVKHTENGTFILQLSCDPKDGFSKPGKSSLRDGFKKTQDRPVSRHQAKKDGCSKSGMIKTCFLPDASRPQTSKGHRNRSCMTGSVRSKKKTMENEECSMRMSLMKENNVLQEKKCPQSSYSTRRRVQSHIIQPKTGIDQQFLSLFAK